MVEAPTPEQWRQFDDEGFCTLGVALGPAALATLSGRLDAIEAGVARGVDYNRLLMQTEGDDGELQGGRGHKGPGAAYSNIQGLEHDPVVYEFLRGLLFRCVG